MYLASSYEIFSGNSNKWGNKDKAFCFFIKFYPAHKSEVYHFSTVSNLVNFPLWTNANKLKKGKIFSRSNFRPRSSPNIKFVSDINNSFYYLIWKYCRHSLYKKQNWWWVFSCSSSTIPTILRWLTHSQTAYFEFGPKEWLLRLESDV